MEKAGVCAPDSSTVIAVQLLLGLFSADGSHYPAITI